MSSQWLCGDGFTPALPLGVHLVMSDDIASCLQGSSAFSLPFSMSLSVQRAIQIVSVLGRISVELTVFLISAEERRSERWLKAIEATRFCQENESVALDLFRLAIHSLDPTFYGDRLSPMVCQQWLVFVQHFQYISYRFSVLCRFGPCSVYHAFPYPSYQLSKLFRPFLSLLCRYITTSFCLYPISLCWNRWTA